MTTINPLAQLPAQRFETPAILKKLAAASRALAELKGVAASIPNQGILINTLGMQEAKDSSAIENIVTTHDELFKDDAFPEGLSNPAAKEVLRYRQAMRIGFEAVVQSDLLTVSHMIEIQVALERNNAGLRKLPGTALKDAAGRTVYTPPQDHDTIVALMSDLERFINDDQIYDADPLIKMALIHHQFESIHPFYDGNGRTGRIVNVLYLIKQGLLDTPVLYMSRQIVRTKADYYRLLQAARAENAWEDWVVYMLTAVERSAIDAIATINAISAALMDAKHRILSLDPYSGRSTYGIASEKLLSIQSPRTCHRTIKPGERACIGEAIHRGQRGKPPGARVCPERIEHRVGKGSLLYGGRDGICVGRR